MLTAKEEKFVAGLIKGLSQRQAYKKAFAVKWKDSTIDSKASTLFKSDKVQERYKELLQEVNKRTDEEAIMSAQERLVFLSEVVREKQLEDKYYESSSGKLKRKKVPADIMTKIKSIDTMNKMTGEYKTILSGNVNIDQKLEDLI